MTIGLMEITLVKARGLNNSELFGGKIDPYVVIQFKDQEHKSTVAKCGQGSKPVWNEKFTFRVEYPGSDDHEYKLLLSVMDKDTFSADDYLGQCTIYLKDLFEMGVENGTAKMEPTKYSIVDSYQSYCGDIEVAITFTPKVEAEDEEFGGWRESDRDYFT